MAETQYVRTEQLGDALVVTPLFTYAAFAEPALAGEWSLVQQLVESPGVKNVIVDLSQIPYFGSTVLEWMVQMWKRASAKGGKLATCQASPIGREVLSIARFDKLWGSFDSRDEAVAWLAAE
jgi:anti-anti-sigma factor